MHVKVTETPLAWYLRTRSLGLRYSITAPKCVSMPTRVKLGCTLKGGGQRSGVIKGRLLDSKWKWGCFLPWGSFIFPGTGSEKKEYPSCWEVDLIFKSADGNTMHILSDGYSPVECFVEFVATGEFPETSSSARRTNRSQASVATTGFAGLPTLCNLCVQLWGEVNERYGRSPLPHLCMGNEVSQEARCTTRRKRFEKKTKSPLFWADFAHVRAVALPCTVIWYKQAHKGGQWCGGVPLRGRWGW